MMNCIYKTSTWTFSKETSHTHKHPKYTNNKTTTTTTTRTNCMVRVYGYKQY